MKMLDKRTTADAVKLLIFIVVTTVATSLLVITIGNVSFGETKEYKAVFSDATGVVNGDAMRMIPEAIDFVQVADEEDKPIAVICHGGWLLISADLASGRTVTSWPSLQDDFRNAGSNWVDEEVVCDGNLITSRKPDDIPAFNQQLLSALGRPGAAGLSAFRA